MKMTLRGFNMIDLKRDELVERLKNNVCVVNGWGFFSNSDKRILGYVELRCANVCYQ